MLTGTQGETEAGAGHAVQWDVVTVEDIAAPAQDAAVALQNKENEMWPTGLDQVVVAAVGLDIVVAVPQPIEEGQDPGPRALMPRGLGLLMPPQQKEPAQSITAGAAAARDPVAPLEAKAVWFHTEMWYQELDNQVSCKFSITTLKRACIIKCGIM
jgi:hypothetical protein